MQIEEIKDQICDVCHKMWQLGWVAANDGNVSVRLEDGTFLATPTGMSKSFITPDKLLRIDAKGNVLEGAEGLRPSSEIKMHMRSYYKITGKHPGYRKFERREKGEPTDK
mgnify:CR=1 FL=1